MSCSSLDVAAVESWLQKAYTPGLFRTPIEALRTATWRGAELVEGRAAGLNSITMVYTPEHYKGKRPASTAASGSSSEPARSQDERPPKAEVVRPFDSSRFNFRKASVKEHMLYVGRRREHALLPNVSPIMPLHSLLVPHWRDGLPQLLDARAAGVAFETLCLPLERSHPRSSLPPPAMPRACGRRLLRSRRLLFNSLGAYSSVNHLHFHLVYACELARRTPGSSISVSSASDEGEAAAGSCFEIQCPRPAAGGGGGAGGSEEGGGGKEVPEAKGAGGGGGAKLGAVTGLACRYSPSTMVDELPIEAAPVTVVSRRALDGVELVLGVTSASDWPLPCLVLLGRPLPGPGIAAEAGGRGAAEAGGRGAAEGAVAGAPDESDGSKNGVGASTDGEFADGRRDSDYPVEEEAPVLVVAEGSSDEGSAWFPVVAALSEWVGAVGGVLGEAGVAHNAVLAGPGAPGVALQEPRGQEGGAGQAGGAEAGPGGAGGDGGGGAETEVRGGGVDAGAVGIDSESDGGWARAHLMLRRPQLGAADTEARGMAVAVAEGVGLAIANRPDAADGSMLGWGDVGEAARRLLAEAALPLPMVGELAAAAAIELERAGLPSAFR